MSSHSENFPGASPSKGTIRAGAVVAASRGANSCLSVSADGQRLTSAWCSSDSTIDVWGLSPVRHLSEQRLEVELTDVGSQADYVLLPPGAGPGSALPAHLLPVVDMAVSADVTRMAATAGRTVRVFGVDSVTGALQRVATLRGHQEAALRVALSRGGAQALSTERAGRVTLWSVDAEQPVHHLSISRVPQCASFVWNDMLAAVGDDVGRVICWELQQGRRHLQFQAHRGSTNRLTFDNGTGQMVTAGSDHAARIWNLEAGKQVGIDMVHRAPIHDVAFARGGRYVVTAGGDGHVAIWSARDGALIDWFFHSGPVFRVAVSPHGPQIYLAGPNTITSADVDWNLIGEFEQAQQNSRVAALPAPVSFAQPPARPPVTYSGQGAGGAPVGSILAARQTTDLPFPDRSNLVIHRDQTPPAPRPPAPDPRGAFGARTGAVPAAGVPSRGGPGTQRMAPVPAPAPPAPEPPASDAASFFGAPSPVPSRSAAHQAPAGIPPRPSTSEQGPPESIEDIVTSEAPEPRPVLPPRPAQRSFLSRNRNAVLVTLLVSLLVGLGVRFAVHRHFAEGAWPADVAAEAESIEAAREEAVGAAEADLERYIESQ